MIDRCRHEAVPPQVSRRLPTWMPGPADVDPQEPTMAVVAGEPVGAQLLLCVLRIVVDREGEGDA